ncbi:MAG: acetoin utilization protein AcuC [Actinomycetes bacterium]
MSDQVAVIWDAELAAYDFGPGHPLAPIRVQLAHRLASDLGVLTQPNVTKIDHIEPVSDEDLLRVHEAEYVHAVKRAGSEPGFTDVARGLGTTDDPVFPGMHEAAARVVGASIAGARAVLTGGFEHAVNLAGGLHHAMPGAAEGFCVYNDCAAAIAWLLDQGVERVAYIDIDVHHGDGVQTIFWDDPRVLTISLHEGPRTLFPGTGYPHETGGRQAPGSAINVAIPAGSGDDAWLRAFQAVVPPAIEAFAPSFIVSQHGCDTHFADPLAHLTLTIDGQRLAGVAIHRLAHRFADGKWLALGGGGYEWIDVVPRTWAHLLAEVAGSPLDPNAALPPDYREHVFNLFGRAAPLTMTDGADPWARPWESGYDPDDPIDRAILATRAACFPFLGLNVDPFPSF